MTTPGMTHTPDCTDCGCDETCTAPIQHEHDKACFATGCPAIREAHREQSRERFARVRAAVARELDGLGLTPGDFYADSIAGVAIDAIFPPTDGPRPGDARPVACGCVDGMGRMDRSCHSFGLCRSRSRHGRGLIVECRRCKGNGWTGPNDPRPGVTCDDCNGTGEFA